MNNNFKNLVIYDYNENIIGSVREKTNEEVSNLNKENAPINKEKVLKKVKKR